MRHLHPTSGPLGISVGLHHLPRQHQNQQNVGMMGKPYNLYGVEPLIAGGLEELRGISGHNVYKKIALHDPFTTLSSVMMSLGRSLLYGWGLCRTMHVNCQFLLLLQ